MTYINPVPGIVPAIYRESKKEQAVSGQVEKRRIRYDNRHTNWSWKRKWLKNHPLKSWMQLW